jgi:adenylate cyclase
MEHPRIKLKPKTRVILLEWSFIIVCITSMMYLYYFFTWWAMEDYLRPNVFDEYMDSGFAYLEILIQGILFGVMFGLINLWVDNTGLRRKSFGFLIFFKTIFYALAVTLSQMAVFAIYHVFSLVPVEILHEMRGQVSIKFMISLSVYFLFVILLINLILQINRKFGYGVLLSMLTGKYHKPRQERRIFMFLDMKGSTGNAERLGHIKYSRLIQSCISDLTDLIIRYKAQVYQYVGDEVVLTWPTRKGVRDLNCINLFYAFEQRLKDRQKYYEKNYGIIPEFKAGLDEGKITVTEVGDVKRELAYHGEVLHTAARLEKMCNNLEKKILITQSLITHLPSENGYEKELMGEYEIRGKENKEMVFGVVRVA